MCLNDCSGRGACVDGECSCFAGYFNADCSTTIATEFPEGWLAVRLIIGFAFAFLALIAGLIIISLHRKKKGSGAQHYRIARLVVLAYFSHDFSSCIIYFLDQYGTILPYWLISIWYGYSFMLSYIY